MATGTWSARTSQTDVQIVAISALCGHSCARQLKAGGALQVNLQRLPHVAGKFKLLLLEVC